MASAQQHQKGCDCCAPFRETFNKTASGIAQTKSLTALFAMVPMIMMIVALIYFETTFDSIMFNNVSYQITTYKYIILSPLIVVSTLTFLFGSLALAAIKFELQNLLGFCSFVYASIAYWAIINILIVAFCLSFYFSFVTVGAVVGWAIPSALIWLFTGAVMDAHRKNVNAALAEDGLAAGLMV